MSILFSPIGTADPLTQLGDGPMLHIVRYRRPGKVVLFLSPEMARHQKRDGRYTKAIELLADSARFDRPEVELVESAYGDVYRFDYYIAEFEGILSKLVAESGDEPVLVNATSGTPAMEQAAVALGAFGRLNLRLLQVTTPKNGINSRHDREDPNNYDLEALWEWSKEIRADSSGERIVEVESPNFADRLLRDNVVALVKGYEYKEAYRLVGQMRTVPPRTNEMIRAAMDRLNLDGSRAAGVFGGTPLAFKANDLLYERLYVMEVRLRQGHWADFLRMMTPALTELMERALAPTLPRSSYLRMENGRPTEMLDCEKIKTDSGLSYVLNGSYAPRGTAYVKNAHLSKLVGAYCTDDGTKEALRSLRNVEDKCRNKLAHGLKPVKRATLEREGGMGLEEVMQTLFELHGGMTPGLYDRINEEILQAF